MTRRKLIGTSILLLALVGLCIYVNRDFFEGEGIQIYHRNNTRSSAPGRGRGAVVNKANSVLFGFNHAIQLNSLKVVAVAELKTNKYAHAYWEMVTTSNSVPMKGFEYGSYIRGMHPKVPNAHPEPLQPGETYRLLITSGSLKGQHDFEATPRMP
jgi:hypothetical protein